MDAQFTNPLTQRREHLEIDVWRLFAGMAAFSISLHSQVASNALAALLSNPDYTPSREPGEDEAQAYARRACNYADALITELQRREAGKATDSSWKGKG